MKTINYLTIALICIGFIFSCSKDSSDDNIISQVQSSQTNTTDSSSSSSTSTGSTTSGSTTSGSTTSGSTTSQTSSYDRGSILVNYADNIIIPRYNDFKNSLDELKTLTDNFAETPSIANYDLLHEKWVESYKKWQYIEMFNIGKAEEIMFYNKVNTYPANSVRINSNIDENKTDLSNPNDWPAQGFPGIDYMIHGIESSKQAIVDKYNSESKYGIYLKTIVNDMSTNTNIVIDDWETYKASFITSIDNTATSSFNMLINDFVFYFEKGLRTNKIGIPAGRWSDTPLPDRVEAYYSSKNSIEDISKILALESRKASEDLFLGRSSNGDLGPSYKSYLDYLETDLGSTLVSKLEAAKISLNDLDTNFINQINTNNTKMLLAFDALQTIVVNLKTDMLSNFNIAVDYVDADGD